MRILAMNYWSCHWIPIICMNKIKLKAVVLESKGRSRYNFEIKNLIDFILMILEWFDKKFRKNNKHDRY